MGTHRAVGLLLSPKPDFTLVPLDCKWDVAESRGARLRHRSQMRLAGSQSPAALASTPQPVLPSQAWGEERRSLSGHPGPCLVPTCPEGLLLPQHWVYPSQGRARLCRPFCFKALCTQPLPISVRQDSFSRKGPGRRGPLGSPQAWRECFCVLGPRASSALSAKTPPGGPSLGPAWDTGLLRRPLCADASSLQTWAGLPQWECDPAAHL